MYNAKTLDGNDNMVKTSDYILKFNKDFYNPIIDDIKKATIRADTKPLDIGDFVIATFQPSDKLLLLRIENHYAKRLKDLSIVEAKNEGYCHEDLLKHALKTFYPELRGDDYLYVHMFEVVHDQRTCLSNFRSEYEFNNFKWVKRHTE